MSDWQQWPCEVVCAKTHSQQLWRQCPLLPLGRTKMFTQSKYMYIHIEVGSSWVKNVKNDHALFAIYFIHPSPLFSCNCPNRTSGMHIAFHPRFKMHCYKQSPMAPAIWVLAVNDCISLCTRRLHQIWYTVWNTFSIIIFLDYFFAMNLISFIDVVFWSKCCCPLHTNISSRWVFNDPLQALWSMTIQLQCICLL